ncbi:putative sterigmatocystin biosynthesis peroxidase stcC [Rhypophila decipiens]
MQLPLTGIIRGILSPHSKDRAKELAKLQGQEHVYIRGRVVDRGPCPGLNSLANQGYLPRDGKNITIPMVEAALIKSLHHSPLLAHTLAMQLKPLCNFDGTFNLPDMRRHNVVERDVSFTRFDFRHGDNYTFQPSLFEKMVADTAGGPTTVSTLAKTYRRRTNEEKEDGAEGLGFRLYFVSLVQTVSFLHSADLKGHEMSEELLRQFFEEERFPDAVIRNEKIRGLFGLVGMSLDLALKLWFGKR